MKQNELVSLMKILGQEDRDPVTYAGSQNLITASKSYFALPMEIRRQIIDNIGKETCSFLGRYTSRFCGDAIDLSSNEFILPAIMMLELSSIEADFRTQLVRLLIIEHTLLRLKSDAIDFDLSEWEKNSPGTFKSYLQLENRAASLRNLASVELAEVQRNGHTFFEYCGDIK
jgi:hypothetical protein